jgi:hypothetical protein
MSCPVQKAIKELRTGGYGGDDDDKAPITHIGGMDVVCDNASYYLVTRRITFARDNTKELFTYLIGKTYGEVYTYLLEKVLPQAHIYTHFTNLVDMIESLEQYIAHAVRKTTQLNVTLPTLLLRNSIDIEILYNPEALCAVINDIIMYMRKLNVNILLDKPVNTHIEYIEPFKGTLDTTYTISDGSADDLYAHEFVVVKYIAEVEKYHCSVINHTHKLLDICKEIISHILGISQSLLPLI